MVFRFRDEKSLDLDIIALLHDLAQIEVELCGGVLAQPQVARVKEDDGAEAVPRAAGTGEPHHRQPVVVVNNARHLPHLVLQQIFPRPEDPGRRCRRRSGE